MKSVFCALMLLAVLGVASCAAKSAQSTGGYGDHNNDLPSWEQ